VGWWGYYGITLAVICAYGPLVLWRWIMRKSGGLLTLVVIYGASFVIFIVLLYAGIFAKPVIDFYLRR